MVADRMAALHSGHHIITQQEPMRVPVGEDGAGDDDDGAQRLGYRQELRRGFDGLMSFAFGYTVMSPVVGVSMVYGYGLSTGGPACMVWGWIVFSVFTLLIGGVMGEICSTYPCAGSVYYWSGQLGPPFMSYMTGWLNLLANVAGMASAAYAFAEALNAILLLEGSDAGMAVSTQVCVGVCVLVGWGVLNVLRVDRLGRLNNIFAAWQATTTFVIVIAILLLPRERSSHAFVWGTVINKTGFHSTTYACVLGMLFPAFVQSGTDSGAHMAEETKRAAHNAPRGIVLTCLAVVVCGFVYLLGLLYATTDPHSILSSPHAAIAVYTHVCGVRVGRVLAVLLLTNFVTGGWSGLAAVSRMGYAMARDNAFPFSPWLRAIDKRSQVPVRMMSVILLLDVLLLLIPLGTPQGFAAIASSCTIAFQISYAIPITLRVCTRFNRHTFTQSRYFHLGRHSLTLSTVAATWLVVTSIIFLLPTHAPVNARSMNYTCVVLGGTVGVGLLYWAMYARHRFVGPRHGSGCNGRVGKGLDEGGVEVCMYEEGKVAVGGVGVLGDGDDGLDRTLDSLGRDESGGD